MKYSVVSFASTSRRRTTAPIETTLVSTRFLSMTVGVREALLELRDAVLEHHLLVLRVVVLRVLGDLAEFARGRDALRDLAPLVRAQHVELALQLLVALGSEDHVLHETPSRDEIAGPSRPRQRPGMVATPFVERQTAREYHPTAVIDLRTPWRIGPVEVPTRLVLAPMAGRQRAGVPAPGTPLRRRARLLRDGQLRGDRASQREDARLPSGRVRRASARDPALRLRPAADGRRGAHGRGGRRGHRRRQLRLPGEEGDEDRRRRAPPRGAGSRVQHHRGDRRRGGRPGDGQAPARRPERLAGVPRARPAARRGRRLVADAPSAIRAADVHGHRRSRAHRRARLARGRPGRRLGRRHLPRSRAEPCSRRPAPRPSWSAAARRGTRGRSARSSTGTAPSRRARRSRRSSCSSSGRPCASSASGARRGS